MFEDNCKYWEDLEHHREILKDRDYGMMYDSLLKRILGSDQYILTRVNVSTRKSMWIVDYWADAEEYEAITSLIAKEISDKWDLEYELLLNNQQI